MVTLFDSNVWLALAFGSHSHFQAATKEFERHDSVDPVAFCRVTQQSFLRLITTPAIQKCYGNTAITNADAWRKSQDLLAVPQVTWLEEPEGIGLLWERFASLPTASPKVWMDAYLAAFAIGHDAEFATTDGDFVKFEKEGLKLRLLER